MRTEVLGVEFDNVTQQQAVEAAWKLLQEEGTAKWVITPNPEIICLCRSDPALMQAVKDAALVLPDGIGVIYGAKILGTPLKEKVSGIDFITNLLAKMAPEGKRVFLLGSKPGVADQAAENMSAQFPGLDIVGTNDGYFTDSEFLVDKINGARPDLLLVCLGAPKQEKWMAEYADRLQVRLMAGLGGTLDVFAGVVERAPEKWQRMNLEWLYRLLKEPRRIKRMTKLPVFLLAVMRQRLRDGKK